LGKGNKQRGPRQGHVSYTPAYTERFLDDRAYWEQSDPKLAKRLTRLVLEAVQSPSEGIGKPELLKENWQGYWSRRLTDEHRITYRVEGQFVVFVSARSHYD